VIRLANVLRRSSTLSMAVASACRRSNGASLRWSGARPVTLNGLAELMGLDKGQTSRGVSALVARRLVLREYRREGRGIRITLQRSRRADLRTT